MQRIVSAFGKLDWGKRACSVSALCTATVVALSAQTFTTLQSFNGADGRSPLSGLIQATNGGLYDATPGGGASGWGTVFKITPGGKLTTLYSFCAQSECTDGTTPGAGLVQSANGDLYGTTDYGGAYNNGTVFRITPSGRLTTLHSFAGPPTDGEVPNAGMVQATNGDFYGTTAAGGAFRNGTVFKITASGTLTTLYSFCSQSGCTDGSNPLGLVQATNGDFYGVTALGGAAASYNGNNAGAGCGTVFKITPSGTLTTLYSFCSLSGCTDGLAPQAGLVQAVSGDFYGTTEQGGGTNHAGTVFKISPSGTRTTLYRFCSQGACADGASPLVGPVQATHGDFYGTTYNGGDAGRGTAFKITAGGTLTTLYSFCSQGYPCMDGASPDAGFVQDTNGNLYGTTLAGGAVNEGTVFGLSVGLVPFVKTQTTSGKVGAAVKILGTSLTGASSVSFNGTAAIFKVVSSSEITTTVPAGATTGKVEVATPSGTLSSNVPFRMLP
jgi:uncharacterized repeat protein (TIGR03803 family)